MSRTAEHDFLESDWENASNAGMHPDVLPPAPPQPPCSHIQVAELRAQAARDAAVAMAAAAEHRDLLRAVLNAVRAMPVTTAATAVANATAAAAAAGPDATPTMNSTADIGGGSSSDPGQPVPGPSELGQGGVAGEGSAGVGEEEVVDGGGRNG